MINRIGTARRFLRNRQYLRVLREVDAVSDYHMLFAKDRNTQAKTLQISRYTLT